MNDDELRREILVLADMWFSQDAPSVDVELHDVDAFLNCVGYATAAAECVLAYLDVDPDNRIPMGILARSLYELGLTCVWLSLTGANGFSALVYESQRQNKALAGEFEETRLNGVLRQSADRVLNQELPRKPSLADTARNIDRVMDSLEAGDTNLYAIYRMYSRYAHASLDVANSYISADRHGALRLQIPGRYKAMNEHLGTAVAPFVWAVNAVNKMHSAQPFSTQLEKLKVALGTGIDFALKK
ncbi:MAG: DUF5677 domain-containing protein [Actinomycetota bacterium]